MHAVAVGFDFVEPLVAFGRRVDELRALRRNPLRQRGRICALPRYRARRYGGMGWLLG
jgi:hypothetical protein